MKKTPPTDIIRDGNLKASIWQNESEKGPFYTTTFAKIYKAQNGELRDTQSFSNNDLLRVSELARQAYSRTNELRREHYKSLVQERTPQHIPERTPERTQESRAQPSPEYLKADRKSRLEAFRQERREDRSRQNDFELER